LENLNIGWYEKNIEPGVRVLVRKLRNAGINTTSSCEHEGYIECETYEPSEEYRIAYDILAESGYTDFKIEFYFNFGFGMPESRRMYIRVPKRDPLRIKKGGARINASRS
jgi:hypothetical protein